MLAVGDRVAFRSNDLDHVTAIRERAAGPLDDAANAAIVADALGLWRATPADELVFDDPAVREVWDVLHATGLAERACLAALARLREGTRLRPAAYIDVVEYLVTLHPGLVFELATRAFDVHWPVVPYLGSCLLALVDGGHREQVWAWITARRAAMMQDDDRWLLASAIALLSRTAMDDELIAWLEAWSARARVPLWIVDAYLAYRRLIGLTLVDQADDLELAWRRCIHDETRAVALVSMYLRRLRRRAPAEADALYAAERPGFDPVERTRHPFVRYLAACRHARLQDEHVRGRLAVILDNSEGVARYGGALIHVLHDLRATPSSDRDRVLLLGARREGLPYAHYPTLGRAWRAEWSAKTTWIERVRFWYRPPRIR